MAIVGIVAHHIPENGPIAYGDHGFGDGFGKIAEAHA